MPPSFCMYLPGRQISVLQDGDSDDGPEQLLPPCSGNGSLHDLYLVLVPPPRDPLPATTFLELLKTFKFPNQKDNRVAFNRRLLLKYILTRRDVKLEL